MLLIEKKRKKNTWNINEFCTGWTNTIYNAGKLKISSPRKEKKRLWKGKRKLYKKLLLIKKIVWKLNSSSLSLWFCSKTCPLTFCKGFNFLKKLNQPNKNHLYLFFLTSMSCKVVILGTFFKHLRQKHWGRFLLTHESLFLVRILQIAASWYYYC